MSHLLVDIDPPWSIFAQGDRTLLVTLDAPVSVANGQRCGQAARALMKACLRGVVDIVPSFSSIAVHYQPRLFDSTTFIQRRSGVQADDVFFGEAGMPGERLDIGRRDTPRTALPKGAVAIANRQTIIYPNVSPGGWHVIGITPIELFFPRQQPPTRIAPGD